jgi:hypothetical protein
MRWIALPLLLAVLLAGAACGEENATRGEKPTAPARDVTDTQPVATVGELPAADPTAQEEEAQRLLSLAPTADEFGAAFPDLAPFEKEIFGLGQEWENIELAKHGSVSGSGVIYRASYERGGGSISLVSFGDASGASGAMAEMIAKGFSQPGTATFEVGQGEEAYGIEVGGLTIVLLRQGRVVAFLAIGHPNAEDRRAGMRQLARDVAGRIEDAPEQ